MHVFCLNAAMIVMYDVRVKAERSIGSDDIKTDKLRSIGKQSRESAESVLKKKRTLLMGTLKQMSAISESWQN